MKLMIQKEAIYIKYGNNICDAIYNPKGDMLLQLDINEKSRTITLAICEDLTKIKKTL